MKSKRIKIAATRSCSSLAFGGLLYSTLQRRHRVLQARRRSDDRPGRVAGQELQLHGYVVDKSIFVKPDTLEYRFQIQNKGVDLQASYTGIVPDTFKDGSEVVLERAARAERLRRRTQRRDGEVPVEVRGAAGQPGTSCRAT